MVSQNTIVLSSPAKGVFMEGTLSGVAKPGQMLQIKAGTLSLGRPTFEPYNQTGDGYRASGPMILCENWLLGVPVTTAFADGERVQVYIPQTGEEINVLAANLTGTGSGTDDAFAAGDKLMPDDGTGKFVKATGTVETAPFTVMSTVTAITSDTLVHVIYNGD